MAGLIQIPQPGNVDMGVANAIGNGLRLGVLERLIVGFGQIVARRLDGSVELSAVGIAQIQQVQRIAQLVEGSFLIALGLGADHRGLPRHIDVVPELLHVVADVVDGDVHAGRAAHGREVLALFAAVVGLQIDVVFLAGLGDVVQHQAGVAGVKGLLNAAVHPNDDLGIDGLPQFFAAGAGLQDDLSLIAFRNGDLEAEIHPLGVGRAAPFRAVHKGLEILAVAQGQFDAVHRGGLANLEAFDDGQHLADAGVKLMQIHVHVPPFDVCFLGVLRALKAHFGAAQASPVRLNFRRPCCVQFIPL